jgi:NADH-quinone oxidoreductase subunit A
MSTGSENNLLALLILLASAGALTGLFVGLSVFLGPKSKRTEIKDRPFECGVLVDADARKPFPIKYYLVAILFIVFDVEVAFLYPWAVDFRHLGAVGFISMMVFIGVLLVGLYYAARKHVFDWK